MKSLRLKLGPIPVRILASATAFPSSCIDTEALLRVLTPEITDARRAALLAHVQQDVGVVERAFVGPGERALDLAIRCAREAVGRHPIIAHVHATSTPSRWTGPEAARIGQALELDAPFFDVRSGCTGGLWALVQGARLAVEADGPVLVTAADAFSLTFDPSERMLPLAMGDGAAALVLVPTASGGIARAVFGGRPAHADLATVHAELPSPSGPMTLGGDPLAFGEAAAAALATAYEALAVPADTRLVVHTGRAAVARAIRADADTASLARHGNIGAASCLVALLEGDAHTTALLSAGGGLSFGGLIWNLPE